MTGENRRKEILTMLDKSSKALSGSEIAAALGVSRQVIVTDIALLRKGGTDIISTNKGYILSHARRPSRVFKLYHTPEQCEAEMKLIIDYGGSIDDIFIYHKVYGVVRAEMNVHSRKDIADFMEKIHNGKSELLSTATSGYHYHTISADSYEILEEIYTVLEKNGYLAKLQDYEPVDFNKNGEVPLPNGGQYDN